MVDPDVMKGQKRREVAVPSDGYADWAERGLNYLPVPCSQTHKHSYERMAVAPPSPFSQTVLPPSELSVAAVTCIGVKSNCSTMRKQKRPCPNVESCHRR